MPTSPSAFHASRISRAFPGWSRRLHPQDASRLIDAAHPPYLDEHGAPYSWYAIASEDDRRLIGAALRTRDASARALADALGDKRNPVTFCTPLLQHALAIETPVDTAQYVFQPFKVESDWVVDPLDPTLPPSSIPLPPASVVTADGPARSSSLLEAALHNFSGMAAVGPLSMLHAGPHEATPLPGLSLGRFVDVCRHLDLGRRYQDHLAEVYDGARASRIETAWIQASLDQLRLDLYTAALSERIGQAARQALLHWCDQVPSVLYAGHPLTCSRLELFGIALHEVLVFSRAAPGQINPCILYMPGNTDEPLREFVSAQALGRYLAQHLQGTHYRHRVLACAPLSQQPTLAAHLQTAVFEPREHLGSTVWMPKPTPVVRAELHDLPAAPWQTLYKAYTRKLKADARTLVVPTAEVDAQARQALIEHWLERGLDVLNVAAMLVPGLGQVMLTVSAAQMLDGIFHGLQAWEDDQRAEALGQVKSLLLNALGMAAIGGVSVAIKASGFIDAMDSVFIDEQPRLWLPDVSAYRSDLVVPPDARLNAAGQYVRDTRYYVHLDDGWYEQALDQQGRWRLRHPSDPDAYAPAFVHDGARGWRLAHETPLDWEPMTLARRLDPMVRTLAQEDVQAALRVSETDEAHLRRCHIASEPPPALLIDAVTCLSVDDEVEDLIRRVRAGLPLPTHKNHAAALLPQLPGWPQDHVLELFEGSERWGASVVYGRAPQLGDARIQMTREELASGALARVVVEQLDDPIVDALLPAGTAATDRVTALQAVLADALTAQRQALFDSFYEARHPVPSPIAQPIGRHFTGLPNNVLRALADAASQAEREQLEAGRVPLRIAEEARRLQARHRLERALLGLHRPTLATADTHTLATALGEAEPGMTVDQVFDMACSRRTWAARLLGQQPIKPGFRSPLRLSDGRLGYPLSGRPRLMRWRRNERTRLQDLYPSLTATEREAILAYLRTRGNVSDQLVALQHEQDALAVDLLRWTEAAEGEARESRRLFSQRLNSAWRREGGADLVLDDLNVGTLPSLPARFDHIRSLSLRSLDLHTIPANFLQSFARLERLHVAFNRNLDPETLFQALGSAPQLRSLSVVESNLVHLSAQAEAALASMRSLTELSLRRNLLVLTERNWQVLARLPLTVLDLRLNRITLTPAMAASIGRMVSLHTLDLSVNPLQLAPDLTALTHLTSLQLHDCELSAWPPGLSSLMQRPDSALQQVELSGNRIRQVPDLDALIQAPYLQRLRHDPVERYWRFSFNDLAPQTARRLSALGVTVFEHGAFAEPTEHVNWLEDADVSQRQLWHDLFENDAHRDLREVIERVGRSAQARDNLRSLRRQVWDVLQRAADDTTLRERLNEIAGDFPATCGDAGADAFSALQIEVMAYDESATSELPGPYLFNFYRRLFRRDQVNALAARLHAARLERQAALIARAEGGPADGALPPLDVLDDIDDAHLLEGGVDDIEIRLALRQALAETLEFPEPSQDMLYRETAQVSLTTQFNVEEAVRVRDDTARLRRRWIAAQPAWQRFLRQREAARFEAVDARWYAALEYLESCLDADVPAMSALEAPVIETLRAVLPDSPLDAAGQLRRLTLTEQVYRQAVERISAARQAAVEALIGQLTAEQDPNP
ncbi:NEL-type E3 ubiquitin ligase domain-containing protein [Pseudomonas monteilii]